MLGKSRYGINDAGDGDDGDEEKRAGGDKGSGFGHSCRLSFSQNAVENMFLL